MARLFVSDVHLDSAAPQATEQFLRFLRDEATAAEATGPISVAETVSDDSVQRKLEKLLPKYPGGSARLVSRSRTAL